MGELLGELQILFDIREDLRIDFMSEAGQFHSARVMNAMKKHGMTPELETISALFEQFEKTPATGARMVDALIVEIIGAAEGEVQSAAAPTSFAGCGLCHDGVIVLPFADGRRAVYCDCGRGQFLWEANKRANICVINRPDLKAKAFTLQREERARAGSTLIRFGVDPEASEADQLAAFRKFFDRAKRGIGERSLMPPAKKPMSREQAERALATVRPAKRPPEQLNPESLALAVYANGDERGDIF
jgi:hypothetical protein